MSSTVPAPAPSPAEDDPVEKPFGRVRAASTGPSSQRRGRTGDGHVLRRGGRG